MTVKTVAIRRNLLWRGMHVRGRGGEDGRQTTSNVRIDLVVEGVWICGLEFDYANEESFYWSALRRDGGRTPGPACRYPPRGRPSRIAFLPPDVLAATETRLDRGAVNVRIGEGRTAEVLRNLCFRIHEEQPERWNSTGRARPKPFRGGARSAARYIAERAARS